ncbi:hypothetical protein BSKO_12344 [Bryopsis sp. KO-2023]|nr:hypothetical protein BSKO_12344 [Bryopsis sp. KO-2023]
MCAKKCASVFAILDPFRKQRFFNSLGKRRRRDRISSADDGERPGKRRKRSRPRWITQKDVRVLEDTSVSDDDGRCDSALRGDAFESVGDGGRRTQQGRPRMRAFRAVRKSSKPTSGFSSRPSSLSRNRKGVVYEDAALDVWRKVYGLDEVLLIGPRNAQVTCADLQSLRGQSWVNDEVVNFYLRLVQGRASDASTKFHMMSSYFYTQLTIGRYNYGNVRRWTKRDPALKKDVILMPINLNKTHWILVVVRLRMGVIELYDSLGGYESSWEVFKNVQQWLRDEQSDKQIELNIKKWKQKKMPVPLQGDGSSCGVFTCVFAERVAAGETPEFDFSQDDIQELRLGIAADILASSLD